ncbi:MAG: hypothetical protein PHW69_08305, partial [Elusimicrobiaceae bacterium]|nr:hypothetical protein [Elusimicrobiaceae bacterium]
MNCTATYALLDSGGAELETSKAGIKLAQATLCVAPQSGSPLLFSLRDIARVEHKGYTARLSLRTGEQLLLSELGYKFEDFLRLL